MAHQKARSRGMQCRVGDIGDVPATKGQYARFLDAQGVYGASAGVAIGKNGVVSVAYNGIAARAKSHAEKSSARIESNPSIPPSLIQTNSQRRPTASERRPINALKRP
jgi:hypothetical protein